MWSVSCLLLVYEKMTIQIENKHLETRFHLRASDEKEKDLGNFYSAVNVNTGNATEISLLLSESARSKRPQ